MSNILRVAVPWEVLLVSNRQACLLNLLQCTGGCKTKSCPAQVLPGWKSGWVSGVSELCVFPVMFGKGDPCALIAGEQCSAAPQPWYWLWEHHDGGWPVKSLNPRGERFNLICLWFYSIDFASILRLSLPEITLKHTRKRKTISLHFVLEDGLLKESEFSASSDVTALIVWYAYKFCPSLNSIAGPSYIYMCVHVFYVWVYIIYMYVYMYSNNMNICIIYIWMYFIYIYMSNYRKKLICWILSHQAYVMTQKQPDYVYGQSVLWTMSPLCSTQNKLFFTLDLQLAFSSEGLSLLHYLWANIIYCGWYVIRSWFGVLLMFFLCGVSPTCPGDPLTAGTLFANHPCVVPTCASALWPSVPRVPVWPGDGLYCWTWLPPGVTFGLRNNGCALFPPPLSSGPFPSHLIFVSSNLPNVLWKSWGGKLSR